MATAVVGVGNIGEPLARYLTRAGEHVVLAARDQAKVRALADELGATATSVEGAIAVADTIVFAVGFDVIKELLATHGALLPGKVMVDPSNPIAPDGKGGFARILPDGVSAGAVLAQLAPPGTHYVKAFGTLLASELTTCANRTPRAVLFYATDDSEAERAITRLISQLGFDAVKAGGVDAALRIEAFGDLHTVGGLNGRPVDMAQARAAIAESA
jgi:8-hydroxy-5-deazaflavin:NADPH oxidoreductase